MARKGFEVTAPGRVWPTADDTALEQLQDYWSGLYGIGAADGEFFAFRLTGGKRMSAETLAGIDSTIRADFTRWISR